MYKLEDIVEGKARVVEVREVREVLGEGGEVGEGVERVVLHDRLHEEPEPAKVNIIILDIFISRIIFLLFCSSLHSCPFSSAVYQR